MQEALWDLVWAGVVTNDAWAPLRAPRLTLARAQRAAAASRGGGMRASRRFSSRRGGAHAQVQGRWSLTAALFGDAAGAPGGGSPAAARPPAAAVPPPIPPPAAACWPSCCWSEPHDLICATGSIIFVGDLLISGTA